MGKIVNGLDDLYKKYIEYKNVSMKKFYFHYINPLSFYVFKNVFTCVF